MGYVGIRTGRINKARKMEIVHEAIYGDESDYICLAETMNRNNYWSVLELRNPKGDERSRCIVHAVTEMTDGEFLYKIMDEYCGPAEVSCPLAYLKMTEETEDGFAKEWRNEVRAYWDSKRK